MNKICVMMLFIAFPRLLSASCSPNRYKSENLLLLAVVAVTIVSICDVARRYGRMPPVHSL